MMDAQHIRKAGGPIAESARCNPPTLTVRNITKDMIAEEMGHFFREPVKGLHQKCHGLQAKCGE